MHISISIIVFLCLFLIGLISSRLEFYKIKKDQDYTLDFTNHFRLFCKGLVEGKLDSALYERVMKDSYSMQTRMGEFGVAYNWEAPYSNRIYRQYQLIINLVPLIAEQATGSLFKNNSLVKEEVRSYVLSVEHALLLYSGYVEDRLKIAHKNRFNLIIWLREGVRFFIKLPFLLLVWFGLMPDLSYQKVVQSFVVKSIAFVVAIISFASSIVTLVTGKDQFYTIVKAWLKSKGF